RPGAERAQRRRTRDPVGDELRRALPASQRRLGLGPEIAVERARVGARAREEELQDGDVPPEEAALQRPLAEQRPPERSEGRVRCGRRTMTALRGLLALLAAFAASAATTAGPRAAAPPRAQLFALVRPDLATIPNVLARSAVDGISLQVGWSELELEDGVYR